MTPYLLGSSGALVGVIVAFWYWRKATQAFGDLRLERATVKGLKERLHTASVHIEEERHKRAKASVRHLEEMGQKEMELVVHRKNEKALRDALVKGGTKGLIALANKQYGPVSPGGD